MRISGVRISRRCMMRRRRGVMGPWVLGRGMGRGCCRIAVGRLVNEVGSLVGEGRSSSLCMRAVLFEQLESYLMPMSRIGFGMIASFHVYLSSCLVDRCHDPVKFSLVPILIKCPSKKRKKKLTQHIVTHGEHLDHSGTKPDPWK